jgi:protease I
MEHAMTNLGNKRVAIVATDGFEQSELLEPKKALEAAGAKTDVVSLKAGRIRGWKNGNWGDEVAVDKVIDDARADDYDALVLPGGVINPDKLRTHEGVLAFVRAFFEQGKPVGAICHGPWTLINAGVVKGRHVTSWPSLRQDLLNAGARWTDEEVVSERGLVTSRKPDDLPAFNRKLLEEVAEGEHARAAV